MVHSKSNLPITAIIHLLSTQKAMKRDQKHICKKTGQVQASTNSFGI